MLLVKKRSQKKIKIIFLQSRMVRHFSKQNHGFSLYNSFIDASNGIRKAAHCDEEKLRHFIDKRAQDGALQFSTTANSIFLLLKYKLNQAILYFFCSSVIY